MYADSNAGAMGADDTGRLLDPPDRLGSPLVGFGGSCPRPAAVTAYSSAMASRTRRARAAKKRKRRMDRADNDLSDDQWTALKTAWGGCAYCGESTSPMQRDCVLALSRGGRYTLDNVVPACRSCNSSKCNDEVTGWLRRKRLDERAFLIRHIEISRDLAPRFPTGPVDEDTPDTKASDAPST